MIYFLLPSVNIYSIYNFIDLQLEEETPKIKISNSLSNYLYEIKDKIKECEYEWDIYKKYTNPYEYINSLVPDIFNNSNKKRNEYFIRQRSNSSSEIIHRQNKITNEQNASLYLLEKSNDLNQVNNLQYDISANTNVFNLISQNKIVDNSERTYITHNKYISKCVAKYKPLSRSYFKMIELLNNFIFTKNVNIFFDNYDSFSEKKYEDYNSNNINDIRNFINSEKTDISNTYLFNSRQNINQYIQTKNKKDLIHSFHLAEGPGGFIEALVNLRKNPNDLYVGMTIVDDINEQNVPGWKKSDNFLKNNNNVIIELGKDKTGNILSMQNFLYCRNKYKSSMDLITADGGFDFSLDFNNQEINIAKLLYGQISYALCLQKYGGCFILKIFDCFMQHTIDLLYLLSSSYEKVYITKPQTSRYANSEKYIVCKNFLIKNDEKIFPYIKKTFEKIIDEKIMKNMHIHRFLKIPISIFFVTKLEEYNAIFGQQQIENIHQTIVYIENKSKNDVLDSLIKSNIQKCIHWCIKYKIAYNSF